MNKRILSVFGTCALTGLFVATALLGLGAAPAVAQDNITIAVSPSTLVLASIGDWVTVHAEISYGAVTHETITLKCDQCSVTLSPDVVYADDRGELVVKFDRETVKSILEPITKRTMVQFTLSGDKTDGGTFAGSDAVDVVLGK
ncbi:MAG TPA: hypothetical protein VM118_11770 [Acidobacteriota bacterium]|nr:hypothetical protein [Acidobacteriota bacterium]